MKWSFQLKPIDIHSPKLQYVIVDLVDYKYTQHNMIRNTDTIMLLLYPIIVKYEL